MPGSLKIKLLKSILKRGTANITVSGVSMEPTLLNGNRITIKKQNSYKDGEVIVFEYENDLVVHRILCHGPNKYICKGDNSFKIEDIDESQILGKATHQQDQPIASFDSELISLALRINQLYRQYSYDIKPVILSSTYLKYKKLLFELVRASD